MNGVIEARMDEILENVYARLEATGLMSVLGAGIVITGGGAALKNLPAVMSERLKMEVRYSAVRKGVVASGDLVVASNPEYAVAVGLLAKGTKNCALYIPPKPEPKIEPVVLSLNRQWNRLRTGTRQGEAEEREEKRSRLVRAVDKRNRYLW